MTKTDVSLESARATESTKWFPRNPQCLYPKNISLITDWNMNVFRTPLDARECPKSRLHTWCSYMRTMNEDNNWNRIMIWNNAIGTVRNMNRQKEKFEDSKHLRKEFWSQSMNCPIQENDREPNLYSYIHKIKLQTAHRGININCNHIITYP